MALKYDVGTVIGDFKICKVNRLTGTRKNGRGYTFSEYELVCEQGHKYNYRNIYGSCICSICKRDKNKVPAYIHKKGDTHIRYKHTFEQKRKMKLTPTEKDKLIKLIAIMSRYRGNKIDIDFKKLRDVWVML